MTVCPSSSHRNAPWSFKAILIRSKQTNFGDWADWIDHPKYQLKYFYSSYSEYPVLWVVEVGSGCLLWLLWAEGWWLTPRIACFFFYLLLISHFHSNIYWFLWLMRNLSPLYLMNKIGLAVIMRLNTWDYHPTGRIIANLLI